MKKIPALILILTFLFVSALSAKIIGDFNDDGKVTFLDAIALIIHINGGKQIDGIGGESVNVEPKFERPSLSDEYQNSFTNGYPITRDAVTIVDRVKERAWEALYNTAGHDKAVISGEVSGSASVTMRSPDDYFGNVRDVPHWAIYRVVLENYSMDGRYYVSGEMNYYSSYPLIEIPQVPLTYSFAGTLYIVGGRNADMFLQGSFGIQILEGSEFYRYFNVSGSGISCSPQVLKQQNGECRSFMEFPDTLLFPLEAEYADRIKPIGRN